MGFSLVQLDSASTFSVTRPRIHERSADYYLQRQPQQDFLIPFVRMPYYGSTSRY